jgi:hypothetical protein
VTALTDTPLGVVGGVVSDTVVTAAGALGDDALYCASNAVTWNVTVCPGRSDDQVAVVCGWATDATPDRPSPHNEYERTPTLSVDGSHVRVTLVCVRAVTRSPVGWVGGVASAGGGLGRAAAGVATTVGATSAANAHATMLSNLRPPMSCPPNVVRPRSPLVTTNQPEEGIFLGDDNAAGRVAYSRAAQMAASSRRCNASKTRAA